MSMFEVGDVVVCVDNSLNPEMLGAAGEHIYREAFARLRKDAIYRVVRIGENHAGNVGIDIGVPNSDLFVGFGDIWPPRRFRKVTAADEQFTARIKACRPAHRKVSA